MNARFSEAELAVVRRAYAHQVLAAAGALGNRALEDAYATVPREEFLGPPPWTARIDGGYRRLDDTDPVLVYQDVLFALAPDRGVNNGSPSLHAKWLHRAAPRSGERVAHIGAGTGYYSALLAHLVGPTGSVVAVEFEPSLADQARANLAALAHVEVVCGDGGAQPTDAVDLVYVNFSVERPAAAWLDHLRHGGRAVFPLGVPGTQRTPSGARHSVRGAGLLVTRRAEGYAAESLGPAFFVCAEGAMAAPADDSARLRDAFEKDGTGIASVRSLVWRAPAPAGRCWFSGDGWALCHDEVAG